MKLRLQGKRVIVFIQNEETEMEIKTAIIMTSPSVKSGYCEGRILAVGNDPDLKHIKVGDSVIIGKHSGVNIIHESILNCFSEYRSGASPSNFISTHVGEIVAVLEKG